MPIAKPPCRMTMVSADAMPDCAGGASVTTAPESCDCTSAAPLAMTAMPSRVAAKALVPVGPSANTTSPAAISTSPVVNSARQPHRVASRPASGGRKIMGSVVASIMTPDCPLENAKVVARNSGR